MLGAAFRVRRWSRGLEQREAAAEIGVSIATYRGWETNRYEPDLRHVPAAIRFLGVGLAGVRNEPRRPNSARANGSRADECRDG